MVHPHIDMFTRHDGPPEKRQSGAFIHPCGAPVAILTNFSTDVERSKRKRTASAKPKSSRRSVRTNGSVKIKLGRVCANPALFLSVVIDESIIFIVLVRVVCPRTGLCRVIYRCVHSLIVVLSCKASRSLCKHFNQNLPVLGRRAIDAFRYRSTPIYKVTIDKGNYC
jgi:hypothetical protein